MGGVGTFQRWSLVGGNKVTEGYALERAIGTPTPVLLLYFTPWLPMS
jgi:hypothetical protein